MSIDRFEALGMAAEDARSRAALVEQVAAAFARQVGTQPRWRWFVPGRIEVFGKHTDYAGGRSLLAAVPRGFAVAAGPRADGRVHVTDVRHEVCVEIDPSEADGTRTGWSSYVQVVARRLARNFPGANLGTNLVLASDLPRAAGLSSSSALVVAVATALARRGGLPRRREWRDAIRGTTDLAWYLGCVENGLDYRALPGTAGVGTHGGSEDHTAILTCRSGCLSQYRFVPVTHEGDVAMPDDWTFVVASSGVHADKAGAVRHRYNRASLMARALLELWNAHADEPAVSLGSVLARPGAADSLRARLARETRGPFGAEELARRLAHFAAEDARVPEAARAVEAADAAAFGALSEASQRDADRWLDNQVPETRDLVTLARASGALAASSFGAGFGGSVWAVVERGETERFAKRWRAGYSRRHPTAVGDWFVARPGPSLTEL